MSLTKLEPGQLLRQSSIKTQHGNTPDRLDLTYNAGRGKRFVSILMGIEPSDGSKPIDPTVFLGVMGWVFQPDGVDLVNILTRAAAEMEDYIETFGEVNKVSDPEKGSGYKMWQEMRKALKAMKK